jgi:hypothetical protein
MNSITLEWIPVRIAQRLLLAGGSD